MPAGRWACLLIWLCSAKRAATSPYMGYGFTPGAGATLVFPRKIGHDLARETLLTACQIAGHECGPRLQIAVMPRRDVLSTAIELAEALPSIPRTI